MTAGGITLVLGTVPMHASWQALGRGTYYLCYIGLSIIAIKLGFVELGVALMSLSIVVGLNNEALMQCKNYFTAAATSIGVFVGLSSLGVWLWTTYTGFPLIEKSQIYLREAIKRFNFPQESVELLSSNEVLTQLPSVFVLLLGVSLAMTLIFEKKVFSWMELKKVVREPLSGFRVPNVMIWIFIVSLLGAFTKQGPPLIWQVSMNVLNVAVLTYFFQGLAILYKYFESFKFSVLWRVILTTLLILYLPFLLSLIGVLDYWIDFRGRLMRKTAQIKERRER